MIKHLVSFDNPSLTTKTELFDFNNPPTDITQLSLDLIETMNFYNGIGLSANQIGLPYRVFVMRSEVPFVCFNPKVVMPSTEQVELEEGCLSLPGLTMKVMRPRHVKVRFQTPSGAVVTKQFTGMTARCFMHEMDHMDGNYFFNGVGRMKMDKAIREAKKKGFDYEGKNLLKHALA